MNVGDPELVSPNEFIEGGYSVQKFDPLEVGLGIYKNQQVPVVLINGQTEYRTIPIPLVQTGVDRSGNMTTQIPTSIDSDEFFEIAADYLKALGEDPESYMKRDALVEGLYDINSPASGVHIMFSRDETSKAEKKGTVEITIPQERLDTKKPQPNPIKPLFEAVSKIVGEEMPEHLFQIIVLTQELDREKIVKRLNELRPSYT